MPRTSDISNYFSYELAPVRSAFIKDNMMQNSSKSSLAKELSAISEKKKEEGNISCIEFDDRPSDEGDFDDYSTDSDSEDSDDADIKKCRVNEENMQR